MNVNNDPDYKNVDRFISLCTNVIYIQSTFKDSRNSISAVRLHHSSGCVTESSLSPSLPIWNVTPLTGDKVSRLSIELLDCG